MNKSFVIYTVMVGKYGNVYQPEVIDDRFDYILFSNDLEGDIGVWHVRHFPLVYKNDNKRLSRFPKSHPVSLLKEYDASLYIDANIRIVDSWVYERFSQLYQSETDIAGVQLVYTGRDCIYEHSYDMCVMRAEHDFNAIVQMHALRKRGFPDHFGLNENNLIWRRHNATVETVDDEWWRWITHYSYRDQFSYMYCLWKYGINRTFFLPEGEDTTSSPHFERIQHNDFPQVSKVKWVKEGFFESYRNRCRTLDNSFYDLYCKQWVSLSKYPFPRISLFIWGFFTCVIQFYIRHVRKQ